MFTLIKSQDNGGSVSNVINMLAYSRYKKVLNDHNTYVKVLPIMQNYLISLRKFKNCDNLEVLVMMLEMDIEEIKYCIEDCRVKLFELEKEIHE